MQIRAVFPSLNRAAIKLAFFKDDVDGMIPDRGGGEGEKHGRK